MMNRRQCLSLLPPAAVLALLPARTRLRAAELRLHLGGTGMALAAMRQVGLGFISERPNVAFEVKPSLGTSGGLSAMAAGVIDLALLARDLTEAERARGLRALAYARTPIAFVTHPDNAAVTVSVSDIVKILSGEFSAWPDGTPVRLVRREPSDADWTMFRRLSPALALAVEAALKRPGLLTVGTDQENAAALQRLRGSFGAVSLGQLYAEALRLKPLSLGGVTPSVATLESGDYPLSRTLFVAWVEQPAPPLAAFLDYLGSAEAQAVLGRLGHARPVTT